jgi:hypothetical protein
MIQLPALGTDFVFGIVAEVAQPLRRNPDTAAASRSMITSELRTCARPGSEVISAQKVNAHACTTTPRRRRRQ